MSHINQKNKNKHIFINTVTELLNIQQEQLCSLHIFSNDLMPAILPI